MVLTWMLGRRGARCAVWGGRLYSVRPLARGVRLYDVREVNPNDHRTIARRVTLSGARRAIYRDAILAVAS